MQELQTQVDRTSELKPTLLQLLYFPSKTLAKKSQPILESIPDSKNLQTLIDSMFMTMHKHNGVGLSAIQVGVPLALFVLHIDGISKTVINPSILSATGESFQPEGCLSIPHVSTRIVRPATLKVSYLDEKGGRVEEELTGLWAKAFSHEFDHLQGKTMYDHLNTLAKASFLKKVNKVRKVLGLR